MPKVNLDDRVLMDPTQDHQAAFDSFKQQLEVETDPAERAVLMEAMKIANAKILDQSNKMAAESQKPSRAVQMYNELAPSVALGLAGSLIPGAIPARIGSAALDYGGQLISDALNEREIDPMDALIGTGYGEAAGYAVPAVLRRGGKIAADAAGKVKDIYARRLAGTVANPESVAEAERMAGNLGVELLGGQRGDPAMLYAESQMWKSPISGMAANVLPLTNVKQVVTAQKRVLSDALEAEGAAVGDYTALGGELKRISTTGWQRVKDELGPIYESTKTSKIDSQALRDKINKDLLNAVGDVRTKYGIDQEFIAAGIDDTSSAAIKGVVLVETLAAKLGAASDDVQPLSPGKVAAALNAVRRNLNDLGQSVPPRSESAAVLGQLKKQVEKMQESFIDPSLSKTFGEVNERYSKLIKARQVMDSLAESESDSAAVAAVFSSKDTQLEKLNALKMLAAETGNPNDSEIVNNLMGRYAIDLVNKVSKKDRLQAFDKAIAAKLDQQVIAEHLKPSGVLDRARGYAALSEAIEKIEGESAKAIGGGRAAGSWQAYVTSGLVTPVFYHLVADVLPSIKGKRAFEYARAILDAGAKTVGRGAGAYAASPGEQSQTAISPESLILMTQQQNNKQPTFDASGRIVNQ